jgi:acyl-CoA hydrolase
MTRPQSLTPAAALAFLRERTSAGSRIHVAGCSGEPLIFADALREQPDLARGFVFHGVWIPGVNRTDYAGFHPETRAETIFLSPELRESFDARRVEFLPLSYAQTFRRLETAPIAAALVQTSAPDRSGRVSIGVSADFSPAVLDRFDVVKIAHINPAMPAPAASYRYPLENFDAVVEGSRPLLAYEPPAPSAVFDEIARHVASLVGDGATLQFGLGNVQLAAMRALASRKRLSIHSGMVSRGVLDLISAGAIDGRPGSITTGVALGAEPLYATACQDARFRFEPVSFTHAQETLARIPDLVAINSVIEVDLFGQANAEFLNGRQISGAGGLVDFLRGAAGRGKPIVALASTAKGGSVSRITPRLDAPAVSIARADLGFVVTEYGVADLRGLSVEKRAQALVAIAHPAHRKSLEAAWSAMQNRL